MTSDAKIGLLLGLAFIFIIAFIINGLPGSHKDGNNNELTTNMVSLQNNPPAIAARERDVINQRESAGKNQKKVESPSTANQDIRFTTALPKGPSVAKETVSNKTILPKVYVVNEGDSLAIIAQKCYGSQEGNKRINITRIFDANRRLLKSPDEIYVGQKLIIPPLLTSVPDKSKIATVLSGMEFTKIESIGERHLLTDGHKAEKSKLYTVREGDSLWQIADEQLGNGSRYSEIAELNADILDSEDNLSVGTRLRIPVR
jgi:nucleoid-associated protein YgaU